MPREAVQDNVGTKPLDPPEIFVRNKTLDFDLAAIGRTSGPRKLRIENP